MSQFKVSVITPIYKTEKDLDKCLNSLVAQTLPEIELIWIDNGTNNECREIIQKYAKKRQGIKVITLKENIGYCGAMNKGLSEATGEYIGFCDSDDYVDSDYYEKLYQGAAKEKAQVVYCGAILEYENKSVKHELLCPDQETPSLFDHLRYGSIWNALFKRDFIQKNNISFSKNKTSIYRDNTFSIPAILAAQKTAIVKDTFYHYVQHQKSTVSGLNSDIIREQTYQTLQEVFSQIKSDNFNESLVKFLFRTLALHLLDTFPDEMAQLTATKIWKKWYANTQALLRPTIGQRLFSISYNPIKHLFIIRFLGISFKIKRKEKNS